MNGVFLLTNGGDSQCLNEYHLSTLVLVLLSGDSGCIESVQINNICTDQLKLKSQKATNITRNIKPMILNRMYNCVVFMT